MLLMNRLCCVGACVLCLGAFSICTAATDKDADISALRQAVIQPPTPASVNPPSQAAHHPKAVHTPLIWSSVTRQFRLLPQYQKYTAVSRSVSWFLKKQDLLTKVIENSAPYIYYVLAQVKKNNLPSELALLPMIESGYDPYAYSNRTATGLWQMMPTTAADLGSEISWWYDARRDTVISTQYALQYLRQLHHQFQDWLLAIAAYNVGPARIERAIRQNKKAGKKTDFWSLPLPQDTKCYIPNLLALAQIIAHPNEYNITLPNIPNKPYFSIIPIQSQITLTQTADLANTSESAIQVLNPGLRRWAAPPNTAYNLLIPAQQAKNFKTAIQKLQGKEQITWIYHEVRSGETLKSIAKNYYTTTSVLKKANGLSTGNHLAQGQGLLVPIRLHEKFTLSSAPINLKDAALPSEKTAQKIQKNQHAPGKEAVNLGQQIRKDDSLKTILGKLYAS
jgi:membrane-bound lytic murein transglycosylase D